MPNTVPISEMKNITIFEAAKKVSADSPLFVTNDGQNGYALIDLKLYKEYRKAVAGAWLMKELEKGEKSGDTEGWVTAEEVRRHFNKKRDEA